MTPLLKNLLGNGSRDRELTEEMRAVLQEMRQERDRYVALIESSRASADRLQELGEPIARAGSDMDTLTGRLDEIQQRLEAMAQLTLHFQTLDERAEILAQDQQKAGTQVAGVVEDAQQVRSMFEEIGQKIDLALDLKERLGTFLEVEKPFQAMRGEAETIRGQVEGTGDQVVRLREQHDRLLDAHKLAMSKMEAMDRRREELSRDLQDKERRVTGVEQAVRGMDGVQVSVNEVRRDMGALKAMADLLGQKTASLEAQRETVERALAQAENLDRAMRQVDAGVRQQQENEKTLGALQEQVSAVRSLHEAVAARSAEISQVQREIDERLESTRHDLTGMTDETKKTVDRFDFERRGMESVTQRVADLRATLSDCESRFRTLGDSSRAVGELNSQTQLLSGQIQSLSSEAAQIGGEMEKLQAIRRDLDASGQAAREIGARVAQIEQVRPAVEAAMRDLEGLSAARTTVQEGLEQARAAHGEITRMHQAQSETRSWLAGVERTVGELRDEVGELRAMAPTIEFVQQQTQRIGESMAAIESRREFVEDLQRRIEGVEAIGGQVDERGRQLQERMDAAEQRFTTLAARADEAERMTMKVAAVSSSLNDAGQRADEIKKTVTEIEARAESVEAIAERSKTLKKELEQRRHTLEETAAELQQVSTLRQEAATSVHQLDELTQRLTAALATAEERAVKVGELSVKLEDRAAQLKAVKTRMGQFEERLSRWHLVDDEVTRSLEEITSRLGTVEALKADLDRMYAMAETTAADVRTITSAHQELGEGRELLNDVTARLKEVRDTASALDERKRQLAKAEERLARAEGLLADLRSSFETLQGHKALVDQAVDKAGSLQFLLKQAEAAIEGLREERKSHTLVRSAVANAREDDEADEADDDAEIARAA